MPVAQQIVLEVPYKPFPKQEEFHRCSARYRLFGGAAGPGKSLALLWEAITQVNWWESKQKPVEVLLLRRTFPELEESLLKYFRRDVPWRQMQIRFNESEHVATWPLGSILRFGYMKSESDVYQYQGGEYVFIGLDELTMFTLGQWQYLTSRNRCKWPGAFPNMAGATNPGNIGHKWVKNLWIDKKPAPSMERPEEYNPSDYAFIRATLDDNPIYAGSSSYRRTLEALPTRLRSAFLLGDWDLFAGQYFDIFSRTRHVGTKEINAWHPRWLSIDWGFGHPACAHWHSQDGEKTYTYQELHGAGIEESILAKRIIELNGCCKPSCTEHRIKGPKLSQIYLSPDAFAKRGSANTVAEQLGDIFIEHGLPRPSQADDDRIGGARLMYGLLYNDNWLIDPSCKKLIECLPDLIHDEKRQEDVLKVDASEGNLGDDTYDSARYGLKSKLGERQPPIEVRVQTKMSEIMQRSPQMSMTVQMIHRGRIIAEERSKKIPVILRHRRWKNPAA